VLLVEGHCRNQGADEPQKQETNHHDNHGQCAPLSTALPLTGLPVGTDAQQVVDAHVAQMNMRAAFVGLPAGTPVPEILAAEANVSRPASALRAGAPAATHAGGAKLLDREEAQEAIAFGAQTRAEQRRIEATEAYYGMSLRAALESGALR
jgi:hypothetical protein